jgi:hypothetical protein
MGNQLVILALIQALSQEVSALELQLSQLQAAEVQMVAPSSTVTDTSTPAVDPVNQTLGQSSMPDTQEATTTPLVAVSFAPSVEGEGLVTVKNNSPITVRIKNLDVDGTLAGFTIGTQYGQGFVYPQSFTDTQGKSFDVFTCNGLDSIGTANLGSSGMVDPCVRRDANVAKNELQPGETMILRYTGNPTKVTYQTGSIVDLNGDDVQF